MSDRAITVEIFKIHKLRRERWRWRVRGTNGEILCQSEGYVRRIDAANTALLVTGVIPSEVAA